MSQAAEFPGKNLPEEMRIFNYRLSRARRVSENAFGILAARWRLFRRVILTCPATVDLYVKACCILHNYLMKRNSKEYCPLGFIDRENCGSVEPGDWRVFNQGCSTSFTSITPTVSNFGSQTAIGVRDAFTKYFMSNIGQVP